MVIADATLVAARMASWFDAACQPGVDKGVEDVVDGLTGQLGQDGTRRLGDARRIQVRALLQRSQHRQPRPRHPQTSRPQSIPVAGTHATHATPVL